LLAGSILLKLHSDCSTFTAMVLSSGTFVDHCFWDDELIKYFNHCCICKWSVFL